MIGRLSNSVMVVSKRTCFGCAGVSSGADSIARVGTELKFLAKVEGVIGGREGGFNVLGILSI
jgi:hypothetical protein